MGCDVESQAISFKHCAFQGNDRAHGLLARAHFHKSIAVRFSTIFVFDDIGARYGAIGSQ